MKQILLLLLAVLTGMTGPGRNIANRTFYWSGDLGEYAVSVWDGAGENESQLVLTQEDGQTLGTTLHGYGWTPENMTTEPFSDVLGYSGFCLTDRKPDGWGQTLYFGVADGGLLCLGESFGWETRDVLVDLDGDGTKELVCNCMYGGDCVQKVHVYRMEDGKVLEGCLDSLDIPAEWIQYAGALWSEYDPERNVFILHYPSGPEKDAETVTRETAGLDGLTFTEYIPSWELN